LSCIPGVCSLWRIPTNTRFARNGKTGRAKVDTYLSVPKVGGRICPEYHFRVDPVVVESSRNIELDI
jgi:hypothetical protein